MQRTLGGHRRFPRAAIARLAPSARGLARERVGPSTGPAGTSPGLSAVPLADTPEAPPSWGTDRGELAEQEWYARLSASPAASQMRSLGQRLLGLLIQFVNRRGDDERHLAEARMVGMSYGRRARRAELSLYDAVAACLYFRSSFSNLALPGLPRPSDQGELIALQARVGRFMDIILLGLIAGYEVRSD
jgi:hypothetical protein